ncbi:MAG TPA: DUF3566 domain-containing protein [Actinomycetota bacterium]|nr:DUF3566 domain-containing protein [Actinomycetota bacterium]
MSMEVRGPSLGDRRVVRHVDPRSAARVAFAISLTLAAVVLVGLFALYLLGLASGALRSVEGFIVSFGIVQDDQYRLSFLRFLPGFLIVSGLWAGLMAGLAAISAVLYNLLSEVVGGVEIVTREQ